MRIICEQLDYKESADNFWQKLFQAKIDFPLVLIHFT